MRRLVVFGVAFVTVLLIAVGRQAAIAGGPADEAIKSSIDRAAAYLWSQQQADGSWRGFRVGTSHAGYPVGPTALAAYALLESGVSPQDARIAKALAWLAKNKTSKTYSIALRCNAYLSAGRRGGPFLDLLARDTQLLWRSTANGSYGYESTGRSPDSQDNSNSQYGLLGVWAGARGGVHVPAEYWRKVSEHWLGSQNDDGGWGYRPTSPSRKQGGTSATMTCAGLASLFVCVDNYRPADLQEGQVDERYDAIDDGMDWLVENFEASFEPGARLNRDDSIFYHLYGIERVGLASGYKYFGAVDWYEYGTHLLTTSQRGDGAWAHKKWSRHTGGAEHISTALGILFMSRGRQPVLFNKLRFAGDWNNRPRDIASLTRWVTQTFERPVNWQIVTFGIPVSAWHDAPILYLSGTEASVFDERQMDKLRQFVLQGGCIFSVTQRNSPAFGKGIDELCQRLFPDYPLTKLPPDHPLRGAYYELPSRVRLSAVTNGVRPLVIHCDDDLSLDWAKRSDAAEAPAFKTAANVYMYVTDRNPLRNRGVRTFPARPTSLDGREITLVKLKHGGNFDPEPLAHMRFAWLLGGEANVTLNVPGPMEIADLPESGVKIATITGTGELLLSDDQQKTLADFVIGGGTLIVDAAGGSKAFATSAERVLKKMFPHTARTRGLGRMDLSGPIYRLEGFEIDKVSYRRLTRRRLGGSHRPMLRSISIDGRVGVIFSAEDITSGLLGAPAFGCDGYSSQSAYQLMRNIVLHSSNPKP